MAEMNDDSETLICTVCLSDLYEPTTIKPCLHSFCHRCIISVVMNDDDEGEMSYRKCPFCRGKVHLSDIKPNNF